MKQTVLNFKLEYNKKEYITPHAGLAIYGELYNGIGLDKIIGKYFPKPGSGRGFDANTYIPVGIDVFGRREIYRRYREDSL